jgi:hypothetical protein
MPGFVHVFRCSILPVYVYVRRVVRLSFRKLADPGTML